MKKLLIAIIAALLIGTTFGFILFKNTKNEIETVFSELSGLYLFQIGVYAKEENILNEQSKYDGSIVVKDELYYRLYYGVFQNKAAVQKMQDYLEENKINYYIREFNSNNKNFLSELTKYEDLIINTTDTEVFLKTNAQMLKLYQEKEANNHVN